MQIASYFKEKNNNTVQCLLCPHLCDIEDGSRGVCSVRINRKGRLLSANYGRISAINYDPIEKKPLFHFYPGRHILSVGSFGCNLKCNFCQNWQISQKAPTKNAVYQSPHQIIEQAKSIPNNLGIAYTYNEPTVFYELMLHTSKAAHQEGLKNVMISNGYINKEPLQEILPFMDAFNIDLKAFDKNFYRKQTGARLSPVLQSLKLIGSSSKHLEISFLIIPGLNDNMHDFDTMLQFINDFCGPKSVLHLSRYFPNYQQTAVSTPEHTINRFYEKAKHVLNFVYQGNMPSTYQSNTYCPKCGSLLIQRDLGSVQSPGLSQAHSCKSCAYSLHKSNGNA